MKRRMTGGRWVCVIPRRNGGRMAVRYSHRRAAEAMAIAFGGEVSRIADALRRSAMNAFDRLFLNPGFALALLGPHDRDNTTARWFREKRARGLSCAEAVREIEDHLRRYQIPARGQPAWARGTDQPAIDWDTPV